MRVIPLVRFSYRGVSFNILTTACKQRTPTRKKVSGLQTCRCCRTLNGMCHHDVVYKNGMNWRRRKFFLSAVMHAHRFYIEPWTGSHTRKFKRKKSGNFVMLWTFTDLKISFWQKCDLKFIFPVSSEFTLTMDRNFLVLCVMLVFTSLIGGSNPQSTSGSTTGRLCVWEREKREREREMHMKLFFKNWFL